MPLYRNIAAGHLSSVQYPEGLHQWTEGSETYLIGGALAFVLKDIRSLEHKSHKLQIRGMGQN